MQVLIIHLLKNLSLRWQIFLSPRYVRPSEYLDGYGKMMALGLPHSVSGKAEGLTLMDPVKTLSRDILQNMLR